MRPNKPTTMPEDVVPARAVPPGRILRRELAARGWTQKGLAEKMGRPPQAVNEIVRGKKQITPETAIELGAVLSTSPNLWLNLEVNYRLHLARKKMRSRKRQLGRLPVVQRVEAK